MPSNTDQHKKLKEKLQREKAEAEAKAARAEEKLRELNKRLSQEEATGEKQQESCELKEAPKDFKNLVDAEDLKKDIPSLTAAFDKTYGKDNRDGNVFSFSSHEEAKKFFKEQAEDGKQFLLKTLGEDKYYYSNGSSLFVGTKHELTKHLEAEKEPSVKLKS